MIIIAGGKGDPDLNWLKDAAEHRDLPHFLCYCNSSCPTPITWDQSKDTLLLDDTAIDPAGTALYLRYSMFKSYDEDNLEDCHKLVESHYQTIKGWAQAHPEVGMFNRDCHVLGINKPYNLMLARNCGFEIPETVLTNDLSQITDPEKWIIKVPGDDEATRLLSDALTENKGDKVFKARPWIVQEKLDYPELRIFRVGKWMYAFEIHSSKIDHRRDDDLSLEPIDTPENLIEPLIKMTDTLGIDYGAADFKTCPQTSRYKFLEINTAPTFSGYDVKVKGKLSDAMILHLRKLSSK